METNILEKTAALRPSIEALLVGRSLDLPKELYTAAAARKAVQRIQESQLLAEVKQYKYKVSETAYPGGTRVTRIR